MLLWKESYGSQYSETSDHDNTDDINPVPWRNWPQPPGGFLDLG